MIVESAKENLPYVSIIILTYNGSSYIENLLKSLLDQTYPARKMEIIVADNASTDNTASIVKKNYPDIKLVLLEQNTFFAGGNNRALKYAGSEFVVFLNQDTICHRNWLRPLVQCMMEQAEAGACTSNMIMVDTNHSSDLDRQSSPDILSFYDLSPFGYAKYYTRAAKDILATKIISGCSFLIKKKTVEELGYLFDEELRMYVEDTDLSLRIHNLGYKTYAVKNSVVYHLHSMDKPVNFSNLKTASKAIMNRVYVFFKNMNIPEFILFFPLLFAGGIFKILELRLKNSRKIVYFFPFAFFSLCCMAVALFKLPGFYIKRKVIMKHRRLKRFSILRLVVRGYAD